MAIKVGEPISEEEQEHLIKQLFACTEPTLSPTNRRLLITLDIDYLDNKCISLMRTISESIKSLIIVNVLLFAGTYILAELVFSICSFDFFGRPNSYGLY